MKRTKTFIATIAVGALTLTLAACGTVASADDSSTLDNAAPVMQPSSVVNTAQPAFQQGDFGQQGVNLGHGAINQARGGQMNLAANLPPAGEVDDQEIADMLHMREEEKLARDVYITLGQQWNLPIFTNISKSEQRHMDAIAVLLERYDLEDPVDDNPAGVFTSIVLQALYDQLITQGSQSLTEALKVGAVIEDVDIFDLQKAVAATDNADIGQVYRSLLAGSGNHMRAFVGALQQLTGESYTPQYIDQATFNAIMTASSEHGHGGHRRPGHGQSRYGRDGRGPGGSGRCGRGGGPRR